MNEIQIVYDWLINHFSSNVLTHTSILRTKVMDQQRNYHPLVNRLSISATNEQAILFYFLNNYYTAA
jgi:hypothetical protein